MKASKQSSSNFIKLLLSTRIPKLVLILGLIGSVLTTLVGLTIPLLTRELVDGFSIADLDWRFIVLIIGVFIVHALVDGLSAYALAYVGQKVVARLREILWKKLIRLPVSYFQKQPSGESVSRVINDTGIVKDLVSQHFPQFISGLISIIGAVIILLFMDWKMTLIMFIAVPITLIVMLPLGNKMAKVSRSLQDQTANFQGEIQQTVSEIKLMKSSTAEQKEETRGLQGIFKLLQTGLKEAKIFSVIAPFMYMVVMLVIVMIIGYGGIRVEQGTMTTGSLVAFLLYLFQIVFPITTFAMFFTELQKAKGATERISEILREEEEEVLPGSAKQISELPLAFEEVSFSYEAGEQVLNNLSFSAAPGEMVAFAGPSGGGKTTVFGLIERYYKPNEGAILLGGESIQDISLASWRSQLGYVSQESSMMSGTIRDNLTYGLEDAEEIADEKLWAVAEMAYAAQFIQELPNGMDTQVGERGTKLSGGQRQRINIARAFLRDPKILLLDEATASLDSQSEQVVQKALQRLMEGRTTFVIAHRLATIIDADQIIFIENGEITGKGTHQELLESHELYRSFAEQQLK
ncbi:ABC transporter ATP-binding protein [Oceanobacillus oncorhynchi subsp. incaldanensis]|uniref:Multidrug resistance ABC transporter ATP-binding/permease protein BmrA n=1 Tax=Oceanobacillus oncorhynchi TaxID=545501 RepID=A0A0A1MGS4_9BACI|nr:ABC transporter ATP-binding protein [Oceanobacillus oncorhynchi]GIO18699.1 ABC transporter ATP-binding protein [Oceanobacillus oncorhynchi subsp. incaldanensis]CEI82273.1 Multidrug resistance ABC transporter ATP-binding/permease protein BmrA [Oceanobacillus oncorhynchi]